MKKTINDILTKERIEALRENRNKKREESFAKLVPSMGEAAIDEIRKIYSMFDERMLIWMANLWEPEIGGFYYSNSARDHEGFLPDLESSYQAISFIAEMCALPGGEHAITKVPERFAKKLCDFAYNLQDEDGWFYHPQWGKDVPHIRVSRDMMAAWRLIEPLGVECKYVRATKRTQPEKKASALPEHLQSLDAFKAWMDKRDLSTSSYSTGHFISCTTSEVRNAGPEYVDLLMDWLNSNARPDNGLWEPQVNYASVNGLMKIAMSYPDFGRRLPYPEKSYESARAVILSNDEPLTFACEFYNAWASVNCSIKSMDDETAKLYRQKLIQDAPEMIRATGEKMAKCRVSDGSFAYFTEESGKTCPRSQGALVGLDNVREGDVNGNGCSTRAPLRHMFAAFGVEMPTFYTPEDADFVFELMDNVKPPVKKPVE